MTPEIEAEGLKAYEQVCAFETLRRRGLPWIYAGFTGIILALGFAAFWSAHPKSALALLAGGVIFAVWTWLDWKGQKARYVKNLQLLAELERTYGEQLPWVQVEKHFTALDRLERELAEEKAKNQTAE